MEGILRSGIGPARSLLKHTDRKGSSAGMGDGDKGTFSVSGHDCSQEALPAWLHQMLREGRGGSQSLPDGLR